MGKIKGRELYEAKGVWTSGPKVGQPRSFYASSQAAADERAKLSYGITPDNTFGSFFANVYAPAVQTRSLNWRRQIVWAWSYIKDFEHRDISTITRAELQVWFNNLPKRAKNKQKRPLAASSVKRIKLVMDGIFGLAEDDDVISKRPTKTVRLPVAPRPQKTALTLADLWKLYSVATDRERPFVILAGFCGLRKSEALGVARSAIKDGVLSVTQQVEYQKGRGFFLKDILKTEQSRREIPLPPEMVRALQGDGLFVCMDSEGGYITPKNIQRDLDALCKRAKIDRITAHELRHTFNSVLENDLECPRPIVCALMGKSYQGLTADYNHVRPDHLRKWMTRLWNSAEKAGKSAEMFG